MSIIRRGYSYDDLLLAPHRSDLSSRSDPIIKPRLNGLSLEIPIVSSPMDTVTEWTMATFLATQGGIGIIHRYISIEDQVKQLLKVKKLGLQVGASTGSNGNSYARALELINAGVEVIVVDVAHGHSKSVLNHIERLRDYNDSVSIMSGNIATKEAAIDSLSAGANLLRVGIGAGAACTTRITAGVGVPQLTAIMDIREALGDLAALVADGGIRRGSDVVKALAAGADAVMLGGLLSKYSISAQAGIFRGMASEEALVDYKGPNDSITEGESFKIEVIPDYHAHFNKLLEEIKLGFAYLGAHNVSELRSNAEWIEVSSLGYQEGIAHFGRK